jgi:hypothetical protein
MDNYKMIIHYLPFAHNPFFQYNQGEYDRQ